MTFKDKLLKKMKEEAELHKLCSTAFKDGISFCINNGDKETACFYSECSRDERVRENEIMHWIRVIEGIKD